MREATTASRIGMLGAEHLLANRQRALMERPRPARGSFQPRQDDAGSPRTSKCASVSPHFDIRPLRSTSPDYRRGVVAPEGLREPVSVSNRTGLRPAEMEIGKWRSETGARNSPLISMTEMPKIAGQRLGRASLTRGNVADSHTPGK